MPWRFMMSSSAVRPGSQRRGLRVRPFDCGLGCNYEDLCAQARSTICSATCVIRPRICRRLSGHMERSFVLARQCRGAQQLCLFRLPREGVATSEAYREDGQRAVEIDPENQLSSTLTLGFSSRKGFRECADLPAGRRRESEAEGTSRQSCIPISATYFSATVAGKMQLNTGKRLWNSVLTTKGFRRK